MNQMMGIWQRIILGVVPFAYTVLPEIYIILYIKINKMNNQRNIKNQQKQIRWRFL
jgi:hypothetical protein